MTCTLLDITTMTCTFLSNLFPKTQWWRRLRTMLLIFLVFITPTCGFFIFFIGIYQKFPDPQDKVVHKRLLTATTFIFFYHLVATVILTSIYYFSKRDPLNFVVVRVFEATYYLSGFLFPCLLLISFLVPLAKLKIFCVLVGVFGLVLVALLFLCLFPKLIR